MRGALAGATDGTHQGEADQRPRADYRRHRSEEFLLLDKRLRHVSGEFSIES